MPKLRTSKIAAALAIPLLLAALSACGTDSETPDAGGGTGGDGAGGTSSTESFDDYQLAFAACMRDHGVDMADPEPNAGGLAEAQSGDGFMEASEACNDELGEPPAAPGDGPVKSDEEQRAESLEVAACFRDNGIDVPDPGAGESITVPMDAPDDVLEECAPDGVGAADASAGGN